MRMRFAIALAASLVCMSSACSSANTTQASSDAVTQGIDGKTITIGSSAILSGPYSAYSQAADGLNAYLNYINDGGGINGYKFKVVQQDNAYQAAQSVAVARNLVFQQKAFLLTVAGTTPAQAILPSASTYKVPITFVANADIVKQNDPNVFGEEPSFSRMALADAQYILSTLGQKKIAYAYENDDIGVGALAALPDYVSKQGGDLTAKVGFANTATDYSSYAASLKASGAGAVLVFAGPTSLAGLQRASDAIGYHPTWFGHFNSVTPAYVQLAGADAEGTYLDNIFETTASTTDSAKLFVSKMPAKSVGLLGELGWVQGALITEGVKRATTNGAKLSASSFEAALTTLTHAQVGVWPDATFTPQAHAGGDSADVLQVKSGKFVEVAGFKTLPNLP